MADSSSEGTGGSIKCHGCNFSCTNNAAFCGNCGQKINKYCTDCGERNCNCKCKTLSLKEFKTEKQQQRSSLFGGAGAKKVKKTEGIQKHMKTVEMKKVTINVGLMWRNENGELKKQRGVWAHITLSPTAGWQLVQELALEKHATMDQYFCAKDDFVLLYPDEKVAYKIPSSEEEFTVEKYKKFLNKPYNRINLFLCLEVDYLSGDVFTGTQNNNQDEFANNHPNDVQTIEGIINDIQVQPLKTNDVVHDIPSVIIPNNDGDIVPVVPPVGVVIRNNDYAVVDLRDVPDEIEILVEEVTEVKYREAICPICQKSFSTQTIASHADACAQASQFSHIITSETEVALYQNQLGDDNQESSTYYTQNTDEEMNPMQIRILVGSLIRSLGVNIEDAEEKIHMLVFRGSCFADFHRFFKKQWNTRKPARLTFKFAGENGIDEGGVSREFFTGD